MENTKTKTNNSTSIIAKIIFALFTLIYYTYYQLSENLFEKVFTGSLFLFGVCPIIFFTFVTYLTAKLQSVLKPKRRSNKTTTNTTTKAATTTNTSKKTKEVTTQGYSEARDLFKDSSQNAQLSIEDYYLIKQFIIQKLGDNYNRYKEVEFKNDSHCIYSILKCSKLTTDDYNSIYDYISIILELKK